MNSEEVEALLRAAGRPANPPPALHERVLAIPERRSAAAGWRSRTRRLAASALSGIAAAVLLVAGWQLTSFHTVATVELRGASGAVAEARLGRADGANRRLELAVRGLEPGTERYFELWDLGEQPPMLLATFMTHPDGACVITFSTPQNMTPRDLTITPRGDPSKVLLCSQAHRCTGQAG
jgi:hypothetical protein